MARLKKPRAASPGPAAVRIGDRTYPIPTNLTVGEGRAIKRITGWTLDEFAVRLGRQPGDPDVTCALAWLVLHRADESTTIADVEQILYSDLGTA